MGYWMQPRPSAGIAENTFKKGGGGGAQRGGAASSTAGAYGGRGGDRGMKMKTGMNMNLDDGDGFLDRGRFGTAGGRGGKNRSSILPPPPSVKASELALQVGLKTTDKKYKVADLGGVARGRGGGRRQIFFSIFEIVFAEELIYSLSGGQ